MLYLQPAVERVKQGGVDTANVAQCNNRFSSKAKLGAADLIEPFK